MCMKEKLDISGILSHLPLFQALSPEQLSALTEGTRETRLAKGELLFQKGDSTKGFFVVIYGQIKLALPSAQGAEKVVEILGPNQSFGEAVMFLDKPYPVHAEALGDMLLLHISKQTVEDLLERDPTFSRKMLAGMSQRLHSLIADVESYSLRSSTQRVIGHLLQKCPDDCGDGQKIEIELPTSKQVIASRLNLTPETLSRIFHDLSSSGIISVQGKKITVHCAQRLRAFDL
ncbi:Crp/Fnr family transcriptional regulator [Denitratisoma sp. DHT3]|nr:Crp/Fnr family transcriptional regulator [Denitratisoma sp. DHT3]